VYSLFFLILWGSIPTVSADIFISRHGERISRTDDASKLSKEGLRRAKALSRLLASVPLKAVYCTEYDLSRQTAEPSASDHGLKPVVMPYEDVQGLAKLLHALPPSADVLVIGHSDTIPELLTALGAKDKVEIRALDFGNLFIVAPSTTGDARVHRLHY
jgi:broad specificity phosphatase PhoE